MSSAARRSGKRSVLFWVQHLLGIGHLQRTLRIADALVEWGIAVTVVSGGMPQNLPRDPAVALVQLPPLHARDASFALLDEAGAPLDDRLRECRRAALLAAFASVRPDAIVLEGYPFARRAFRFELDPLIAASRAAPWRLPILCSVRDIVVIRDDLRRHREIVDRARRDIDRVLVHGDPALVPFNASFPATSEIADRLVYTGYVVQRRIAAGEGTANDRNAGEVLVSAGGGAAGLMLLDTALATRRAGCLAHLAWRLITGTNLPDGDVATLRASAPAGVAIERFRDDFATLLRACRVSVSQAGYNTVLDLLTARARAVLVPFAAGRETEQSLRAERLATRGAAEIVRESELSPAALAAAIERAASRPPPSLAIDTDGAARSARLIAGMLEADGGRHWPFCRVRRSRYCRAMTSMSRLEPMPSAASNMTAAGWPELVAELDRWREADRIAKLWWRDDDAAAVAPELTALLRIAGGTPLALAVIPALATADLAASLRDVPSVTILQHGWRHANRALEGKKSEYPSGLPAPVAAAEIAAGRGRLAALFGTRVLPVFVPPWNRIAPELLAVLADNGISAVSTFASARQPERSPCLPPGLALLDTHVDLTDWKDGKRFIGAAAALGLLVFWLRRVRLGNRSSDCAIGILTHHMVMDRETAVFADQLVELVAGHPAGRWVDIAEMLR